MVHRKMTILTVTRDGMHHATQGTVRTAEELEREVQADRRVFQDQETAYRVVTVDVWPAAILIPGQGCGQLQQLYRFLKPEVPRG